MDKDCSVIFKCMFCNTVRVAQFGDLSNLKKHLENQNQDHEQLKKWLKEYDYKNKNTKPSVNIQKEFFHFLLYFLSSNGAIEQLKNKYLRKSFLIKINMRENFERCYNTPYISEKLNESIEKN